MRIPLSSPTLHYTILLKHLIKQIKVLVSWIGEVSKKFKTPQFHTSTASMLTTSSPSIYSMMDHRFLSLFSSLKGTKRWVSLCKGGQNVGFTILGREQPIMGYR